MNYLLPLGLIGALAAVAVMSRREKSASQSPSQGSGATPGAVPGSLAIPPVTLPGPITIPPIVVGTGASGAGSGGSGGTGSGLPPLPGVPSGQAGSTAETECVAATQVLQAIRATKKRIALSAPARGTLSDVPSDPEAYPWIWTSSRMTHVWARLLTPQTASAQSTSVLRSAQTKPAGLGSMSDVARPLIRSPKIASSDALFGLPPLPLTTIELMAGPAPPDASWCILVRQGANIEPPLGADQPPEVPPDVPIPNPMEPPLGTREPVPGPTVDAVGPGGVPTRIRVLAPEGPFAGQRVWASIHVVQKDDIPAIWRPSDWERLLAWNPTIKKVTVVSGGKKSTQLDPWHEQKTEVVIPSDWTRLKKV